MLKAADVYLHKVAALYGVHVGDDCAAAAAAASAVAVGAGAAAGADATMNGVHAGHKQPQAADGLRNLMPEPSHPLFDDFYRQRLAPKSCR